MADDINTVWSADQIEELAAAFHDLYRRHAGPHETATWDELPEPQRESNRASVRTLFDQLRRLGYELRRSSGSADAIATLPDHAVQQIAEAEHEQWVEQKRAQGYIYGPENDAAHPPTHPDLVSFDALAPTAREKDLIRARAAPHLVARLGYEIIPNPTSR